MGYLLTALLIVYAALAQWLGWPRIWLAQMLGIPAWGWWILLCTVGVSWRAHDSISALAKIVRGVARGEIKPDDL